MFLKKKNKTIPVQFILPHSGGPNIGGMETVAADLLHRLNPERFAPALVCFNGDNAVLTRIDTARVRVTVLEKSPGIDRTLVPRLTKHFLKTRPRIVHTFNEGALIYAFPAARAILTRAVVHAEHGRLPVEERPLLKAVRIRMLRACNHIVTVSDNLRSLLIDNEGVKSDKVSVIINGVDTGRFDNATDRAALRAALNLGEDDWAVGTVGSLTPQKNQEILVRAAAKVPGIQVRIAGTGPLRDSLETTARDLGVEDRVQCVGQLSNIPDFLGALDLFALPSLTEATSLALLEAMAARLPAVVTSVGGNPAVVGEDARLVPSEDVDALAEQLAWSRDHRTEAAALGLRARARVEERYSMTATVRAYETLFERFGG